MAAATVELIEHLLERVALSRLKGFTAVEFENEVKNFYSAATEKVSVDEKVIESAFARLCQHEDVDIEDSDENQQDDHFTALQSQLSGKKIFTTESRLWQTIAGHEINLDRIPGMEFELLVIIAQHGAEGILQFTLTALSGQDKHSVPARTDKLARKGYITKSAVVAKHTRTSLLKLSKYGDVETAPGKDMIHYDALFDKTISLLKENGNIISIEDLIDGLDAKAKLKRKVVLRSCLRLSESGCTRLLRCRVMDENGEPVMLAQSKDKEKTTRAIQLLREPTEEDRKHYVNYRKPKGGGGGGGGGGKSGKAESDGDMDDDDDEEEEDADADADEAQYPASNSRVRRGSGSAMPRPDVTPSRKSTRVRIQSNLAKTVDYAELLKDPEEDSDMDAEFEVTESASPEVSRRPAVQVKVPPNTAISRIPSGRRKKTPRIDKPSSGRRPFGLPRKLPKNFHITHPGAGNFFEDVVESPVPTPVAAGNAPTSTKRERKKSTKALEAEALRAAGEPLLTEPVDGYDMSANNADIHGYTPTSGRTVRNPPMNVDGDDEDVVELETSEADQTPNPETRTKRTYKKRNTPTSKKREIPPEEYEEYERYAQAAAERQVRVEMKKAGGKRTAATAGLDEEAAEGSNKVPRTNDPVEPVVAETNTRIAEIKSTILAREVPGIYINPPGAKSLKIESFVQRGRPRNALIAVVKSDGLKGMPWFQEEVGVKYAPKASLRRTRWVGRGVGEEKSPFFVDGSEDEGEGRAKRRRVQTEEGVETVDSDREEREEIEGLEETPSLRRTGRTVRRTSVGFSLAPTQSPASDEEDDDGDDEQLTPSGQKRMQGARRPSPSAAELELDVLNRKRGRPKKEDTIRIAVLRRQIAAETAASEHASGGSGSAEGSSTAHDATPQAEKFPFERRDESDQNRAATSAGAKRAPEPVVEKQEIAAATVAAQATAVEQEDGPQPGPIMSEDSSEQLHASENTAQPGPIVIEQVATVAGTSQQPDALENITQPAPTVSGQASPAEPSLQPNAPRDIVQPGPSASEQISALVPTVATPEEPKIVYATPTAELHALRSLRGKKKTPAVIERINTLQAAVDDADANLPGTMEELTALRSRRGRKPAFVVARLAALERQFGGAGHKSVYLQRKSLLPSTPVAGGVIDPDLGVIAGPSSAPAEVPRGPPAMETPAPSTVEDGNIQTPWNSMLPSLQAPQSSLEGIDASATMPSASHAETRVADEQVQSQAAIAAPAADPKAAVEATSANVPPEPVETPSKGILPTGATQLFTKQYVDAHPGEHFHYRGGGRYALGERFSQAYVDQHPLEKFHLVKAVGRVKYARGSPPRGGQTEPQRHEETEVAATQPLIEAEASQPASNSQQSASIPAEQVQPAEEEAASAPQVEPQSDTGTPITPRIANTATASDGSERFDRAYVAAHPEEHFYHRGKGWFGRGEAVSKDYVDTHPEERFKMSGKRYIRLPGTASLTPLGKQPSELPRGQFTAKYVEEHPDETFYYRGSGRWSHGLPPPGSKFAGAVVRGPGAQGYASTPIRTSARTPGKTQVKTPAKTPAEIPAEIPAKTPAKTPVSSLLTIYRPYSPQVPQSVAGPSSTPAETRKDDKPAERTVEQDLSATADTEDLEMAESAIALDDTEHASGPPHSEDEDIIMEDGSEDDQSVLPDEAFVDEDDEDAQYVPSGRRGQRNRAVSSAASPAREYPIPQSYFPVDLTTAVVIRRTEPSQPKKAPRPKASYAPRTRDYRSNYGGTSAGRAVARGSKMSRERHSDAFGRVQADALLMHPVQSFHAVTGTFATAGATFEAEPTSGRSLRTRTPSAKLPQTLDDDFCETPGLIVKLKVKNLASILPPETALESELFSRNAASDAVPMSKVTGKPKRAYNPRPKKVTFDVDNSDEFQDEGDVEEDDDDDSEEEFVTSDEEDMAVARPERRKASKGVNGELRHRDMASGPAFKDADRLVIAFALVSAICGGLRVEGISWTLIAHALGFRYDGTFLRRRWDHLKRTRKDDVDKLREAIHEPFLAAYEDDDFPRVDFQNLNNTDWVALFDWVHATVVPNVQLRPQAEGPRVPDLLRSRQETEEQYEIKEPAMPHEARLEDYFTTPTDYSRRKLINRYTYGNALPGELRPKDQLPQDMMLLRSWVRAVAATKHRNYHTEAAAQKLRQFRPELLQQVTAEMIETKVFSQERKSRILPGRNYIISNDCLQQFRRWPPRPDEFRFLRFVAQAWKNINTHFQTHDQLSLVPSASDPEYLVLLNLAAQGMVRMATVLPEVKQDYDAPFPKLSPWGYCGPTYETKKVDMSRLKFPIVYTKTAVYQDDHPLLNNVPIPLHPPQIEGEPGLRHPFWVDIHGNLIDDIWDMVLRSILHLLVFRAGITPNGIEQAHGRKIWLWEIELVLEWMREVGIAVEIAGGGWRAGEWWFCAFAPEVARWKAPTVAELV